MVKETWLDFFCNVFLFLFLSDCFLSLEYFEKEEKIEAVFEKTSLKLLTQTWIEL